ncbi:hypothetical protein PROFUN_16211, partial [Planoprotostelium fungivorum]
GKKSTRNNDKPHIIEEANGKLIPLARGEPGDIKTRGTDIRKEGADGLFTILGWTTNLKMNWDKQIELLIQIFMSITNRALATKFFNRKATKKLIDWQACIYKGEHNINTRLYTRNRRQKVWSAFFTCHADPRSLPKKKEPYSNLITKIMTGTIWTNKRKKQYNFTEDDSCKFCSDIMEESIMDSHQHALGECIFTRELNDQLWATLKQLGQDLGNNQNNPKAYHQCIPVSTGIDGNISNTLTKELNDQLWATLKQFWDKSKIRTENILPWFSTSDYDQYEWNLPEEMGNKGLIPRNLRQKISKENKGLNTNSIILATSKPLMLFFSTTRGQLPTPNGLRDPTPPKLAPIYLCICPEGLPYPLLVPQLTYISFATFFFGSPHWTAEFKLRLHNKLTTKKEIMGLYKISYRALNNLLFDPITVSGVANDNQFGTVDFVFAETFLCCSDALDLRDQSKYFAQCGQNISDHVQVADLSAKQTSDWSIIRYADKHKGLIEVRLQKDKCNMSAKHVGSAILSWSKVLMLDYTDSIYMQAKVSSYEYFKQRFPDHLQKPHFVAAGDMMLGKMKLECELKGNYWIRSAQVISPVYTRSAKEPPDIPIIQGFGIAVRNACNGFQDVVF